MKHVKTLAISLLCISLTTAVFVGWTASSRLLRAYNVGVQYASAAKIGESSTNFSLVIYGDPSPARPALDLFNYVAAQNIEWRGSSADPFGNAIDIGLKLGSVSFEELDANNWRGTATALDAHVSIEDLFNVLVKADTVDVGISVWSYMDTFPALNITGVLTGNVLLRLSIAVLPLQGLGATLYEYSGDRLSICVCLIKPILLSIENPVNGARVNGDVGIQARVQAVPAITIDRVEGGTDYGEKIELMYNEGNGLWEGTWRSYNCGNGWHGLNVHAEGFAGQGGQQVRYFNDAGIGVEVDNPWVNSCMMKDGGWEWFNGLKIELQQGPMSWARQTPFNFWPSTDLNLRAQESWADGQMTFNCWRIDDEQGMLFQSYGLTLTVTEDIANMLFSGEGRARELKCVYVPTAPG